MAIYNEILAHRYARALQKLFGIKGTVPAKQLAGEIMAVHSIFNGAENRYLEGWARFGIANIVAAVAAQNSNWQIRMPSGSNVIGVIEKIVVLETIADTALHFRQVAGNADYTNVSSTSGSRFDPRGSPQPTAIVSNGNNVALQGTAREIVNAAANVNQDLVLTDIQEIPLLPGDSYIVQTVAVNTTLTVSCWWRERFLEESERT